MNKKIISILILFVFFINLLLPLSIVNASTSEDVEKIVNSDGTIGVYKNGTLTDTLNDKRREGTDIPSVDTQRKAVIETAESYYRQGTQLQYDSYRKNLTATPEDATSQNTVYTVCSGLVYMSYRQALDIDQEFLDEVLYSTDSILEYASKLEEKRSNYCIFYYGTSNQIYGTGKTSFTDAGKTKFIKNIVDSDLGVQPGDIFVYAKNGKGHAMLVYSVNGYKIKLIEAGGGDTEGRYDVENHVDLIETTKSPTTRIIDFEDRLMSNKDEMCLIRIIPRKDKEALKEEGKGYGYRLTDSAVMRIRYPDIDIGKVITNLGNQSYTSLGNNLTFKITIKNKSDIVYGRLPIYVYENVECNSVKDLKIENLQVETGDATVEKNNVVKINSLAPWDSSKDENNDNAVRITYTVTIPNNEKLNGDIIKFTGIVQQADPNITPDEKTPRACIATSKIETLIGKSLSADDKQALRTTFKNMKNGTIEIEAKSGKGFIDELYKKAGVIDNLGLAEVKNANLIKYNSNLGKPTEVLRVVINPDLINTVCYKQINGVTVRYEPGVKYVTGLTAKYTEVAKDNPIMKYLYSNFYGLSLTLKDKDELVDGGVESKASLSWNFLPESELKDRARFIKPSMLEDGDIILLQIEDNTEKDEAYIFINGVLRRYKSGEIEEIKDTASSKKLTKFLNDLMGKNYIIFRPYV